MRKRGELGVTRWAARSAVAWAFAALVGAGCGEAGKGPVPVLVPEGAKADIYERVRDRGALQFGEARDGVFTEDLELHAYRLQVRGGARVVLENTAAGTDRDLDTVLYVFGPGGGGGFGVTALASDDDSGWGAHARIDGFVPDAGGEYLVVIGTFDLSGRGAYRLEARCDDDECSLASLPTFADACHPDLKAGIDACVDDVLADPEQGLAVGDAVYACTDAEPLGPLHDAVCADAPSTEFCGLAYEDFVTFVTPACLGEVALGRRADAIGLSDDPTPQPSEELLNCGDDCRVVFESYAYSPVVIVTVEGVVGAAWDEVAALLGVDEDSLKVTFGLAQVEEGAHEAFHYAAGVAGGEHIPQDIAAVTSRENPEDVVYVVHFPRTKQVVLLHVDRPASDDE